MPLVVVFGLLFLAFKQLFLKPVPKFLESYDSLVSSWCLPGGDGVRNIDSKLRVISI